MNNRKKSLGATTNKNLGKYYSLNATTIQSTSFDDSNSHQFIETTFGKGIS
jgi:hypothetical protein